MDLRNVPPALLQVVGIALIFASVIGGDWEIGLLILSGFSVMTLPYVLKWTIGLSVPPMFHTALSLYVLMVIYTAFVVDLYGIFWWWDVFTHYLMGSVICFLTIMTVHAINHARGHSANVTPAILIFFAFFASVAMGAIWEILEWIGDSIWGWGMQPSLMDTDMDLLMDLSGAVTICTIGYIFLKLRPRIPIFNDILAFTNKNPKFFR